MIAKKLGKRPTQANEGRLRGGIQGENGISNIKRHAQMPTDDDCGFNPECTVLGAVTNHPLTCPHMIQNASTSDLFGHLPSREDKQTVAHKTVIQRID
jgi:hypothetical protein